MKNIDLLVVFDVFGHNHVKILFLLVVIVNSLRAKVSKKYRFTHGFSLLLSHEYLNRLHLLMGF